MTFLRTAWRWIEWQLPGGAGRILKGHMSFKRCCEWVQNNRNSLFDFIRIYLGVGLVIKGVFFLMHPEQMTVPADVGSMATLVQAVPYVHIVGGLMMALGIFTRLAALVQVPILASAVLFVHATNLNALQSREGFEFSMLVLFLLVLIGVRGAGPFSLFRARKPTPILSANLFQQWVDTHSDVFVDLVRVFLGVGLFVKGLYILDHREQFDELLNRSNTAMIFAMLAMHYVLPAHFVGGASLATGLLTRVSALAQVPLLIGAVFFVYLPQYAVMEQRESLEFSALVLFLLMVLVAHGSGRFSLDHAIEKSGEAQPQPVPAH